MKARMYQFQFGQGNLGWPAKLVLGLVIILGIALLLSFGLIAAVVGGIALLATKIIRTFLPASAAPPAQESDLSWHRQQPEPSHELQEDRGIVRDVEVEILPAEDDRRGPRA
ncbi:hypothetical protein [Brevifollis gellanilyticus]|uniref:Uncharacterized protein n=1 Tax=Brevifollis gellanilyticus TaxID=748831 RepID=A0A512M731_9BACT|nr:hypothetical protein [Brevifollis gellanilyticus]GEP42533.1 hypothetical protein BGE01nite_18240 [Brevifollis gellanilyticus]